MRLLNNNKNTLSIINALNESLTETQNDSDKKSFYDYVVEDFNTYLDHNNISPDNITEEDLGDYFTGFVHEIESDEDIDELNRAEDFIRSKYNIIDNTDDYQEYDDGDTDWAAEEESDALDRFENRYMSGGNGATLKESSNVIWKSEITADDYDQDDLKANQYQDYLNSFDGTVKPISYDEWLESDWLYNYLYNEFNDESNEYNEWYDFINNYNEEDLKMYYQDYLDDVKEMKPDEPKNFEDWFEDYMVDDSSNVWQNIEDDLRENVIPMIDKQVNGALFVTGNYNSNYPDFTKSGPGGKIFKDGDDLVNWLSDEDNVEFTNEEGDQIGIHMYDHDGSIDGLLFTLPDDPHKVLDIALSTNYYDENDYEDNNDIIDDFMYDLSNDNVSMRDIKKPELLVPIKNGFLINESVKSKKKAKKEKKPEERVIMKQGNVTCLKKDNRFKVFEDADTNLVEYDNQEEAMRDALNRCGVNPDNELHEEKDDLKESAQYQVIKTLNVGPSNYQSEVHGTYNSFEQAEDVCNELNAQGIGAAIKEVNEIGEALKKLLLKKEELYNDDTISDEDYYSQIEIIDNIIANNYSVKDIEEAEKELGINS